MQCNAALIMLIVKKASYGKIVEMILYRLAKGAVKCSACVGGRKAIPERKKKRRQRIKTWVVC